MCSEFGALEVSELDILCYEYRRQYKEFVTLPEVFLRPNS